MVSRFLKKTVVFSALAAAMFAFIVSCENPFSNNLGSKVDVEPPTISVTSPRAGTLLDGTIEFEGTATAYRQLISFGVRIFDDALPLGYIDFENLQEDNNGSWSEGLKEKTWKYTLHTVKTATHPAFTLNGKEFPDGFIRFQFFARDPSLIAFGEVQVYVLKNGPSNIKLTEPDQTGLDSWENEEKPQTLITNMYIRGQVVDRRGIKPGYPMIKVWRASEVEPDDSHWGTLFLSGMDDPDVIDTEGDRKGGTYTDRSNMRVVNAAAFEFRLAEFTVDSTKKQIRYSTDDNGNYTPLRPEQYRFRIKTTETYFISDSDDAYKTFEDGTTNYMFPRPPNTNPAKGPVEVEIIGYKPDMPIKNMTDEAEIRGLDTQGKSYLINVITSGVVPTVDLNNDDVEDLLWKKNESGQFITPRQEIVPNMYMVEGTARKIARETDGQKDFRLQVLAHHDETIRRAVLQYSHTGSKHRSGFLMWDDLFDAEQGRTNGYVNDTNNALKAEEGHIGRNKDPANPSAGKLFTFTADGALKDDDGNRLFVSSTEPYYLTVTAYSIGGLSKSQRYTLYLDGNGPTINILGVRGAAEDPVGLGDTTIVPGSIVNNSPYEVNGNIQVSVDRSANMGISSVKWIVEEDSLKGATPNYLDAANTTLAKIKAYRASPTAANFDFYTKITGETPTQGIVKEPIDSLIAMDKTHNLKFNASQFNNKDVWLYVIAEDNVHNLNFVLQKLHVDDSTDLPQMTVQGIDDSIESLRSLYYDVVNTNKQGRTNEDGLNILGNNQAITITLSDDDGISTSDARAGDVSITLTRAVVNAAGTETVLRTGTIPAKAFLTGTTYLETGNSRELGGSLTPQVMADALYPRANPNDPPVRTELPDGLYKLEIEVKDNNSFAVKVSMSSTVPANQATTGKKTYYFAVKSQPPVITFDADSPQQNSVMGQGNVIISGKVESPFQIQKLEVTFDPDVITPAEIPLTMTLNLYPTAAAATAGTGAITAFNGTHDATTGIYTYYWRRPNVNFSNVPTGFSATNDVRKFDLVATDGLNGTGDALNTVRVDSEPPTVMLAEFNFGRSFDTGVNGKVPIDISVSDNNGIQIDTNGAVHVRWWVLPTATAVPSWTTAFPTGTAGAGGQFTTANDRGGGVYRAVVNTTLLNQANSYLIYAIAEDRAGNRSDINYRPATGPVVPANIGEVRLDSTAFALNQDGDYPTLGDDLSPQAGEQRGRDNLIIKGSIMDDDWFDLDTAKAGGYLEIQFPSKVNTAVTPSVPTEWDNPWIKIGFVAGNDNSIKVSTGEAVEFEFDATGQPHFDTQGIKFYRLRITDEMTAGSIALGKNPDGVVPPNSNGNNGNDKYLRTLQAYYPSSSANHSTPATVVTDCYSFLYKSDVPEVYFRYYDPNDTHPGHTQGPGGVIAAGSRPAFNNTDPLAGLKAALQGGYIREAELSEAYFTYGDGERQRMTTTGANPVLRQNATYSDRWEWNTSDTIWNTWLAPVNTANDGPQNIFIEAYDSLGQLGSVQWSFNKDNGAPRIDFTNVSATEVKVIRGNPGDDVFVTGRFIDTASDIAPNFNYQFLRGTGTGAAAVNVPPVDEPISTNGELTGVSATWAAKVPGTAFNDPTFPDGKHTFRLRAADVSGNWTNTNATNTSTWAPQVEFIVDRVPPEMSVADDMLVDVYGQTNVKLPAAERVFSGLNIAATTGTAFTLKGLVYEHNLAGFTASIGTLASKPIQLRITNVDTTAVTQISYDNGTSWIARSANDSNITFRSATNADLGLYNAAAVSSETPTNLLNHLYVWTITLANNDLSRLTILPDNEYRVSVQAQDLANRGSAPKEWVFALDIAPPAVSFYNDLDTTPQQSFIVQGEAKDNTFVKAVYYNIQKWDYTAATPDWRYFNGNAAAPAWNATTPLGGDNYRNWPNLLDGQQPKSEMYFTLNSLNLADSYKQNSAGSKDLPEGRYQLTLWVTDTSLSNDADNNGNPHEEVVDFYVDRNEPQVTWVSTQQNFYRTTGGDFTLQFKATDAANTIDNAGSTASIRLGSGTATTLTTAFAAVTGDIYSQIVTVTIPSTLTASGKYTLSLNIKDKAGLTSTSANFDINIDNTKPTISMTPASGSTAAVTGRVQFKGEFTKLPSESPVNRVAFWVAETSDDATFTAPTNLAAIDAGTLNIDDAYLRANNWHFYDGDASTWNELAVGTGGARRVLMEVQDGSATVNFIIPNTRNFQSPTNSGHLSTGGLSITTAGTGITFNGKNINDTFGGTEIVHKIRIYILVRDEAGNRTVQACDYWVYPAGDYPIISKVSKPDPASPDAERLMNGRILISGTATDNVRVNRVWFRVVDDNNLNGIRLSGIPVWNETTWEAATGAGSGDQTPRTIRPYGVPSTGVGAVPDAALGNWYMANGGGSQTVPWWAYINNEGELDPLGEGSREIRIEVVAEDSIWNDSLNGGVGAYETTGLIGRKNVPANPLATPSPTPAYPILTAWVVKDAPRFEREMIANDRSSIYITGTDALVEAPVGTDGWKNILTSAVRQRASYSVTVRHPELLRSINWDRGDSTIDLLDIATTSTSASHTYNATTYGTDIANMNLTTPTGTGIAVKVNNAASPRSVKDTDGTTHLYYEYDVVVDFHTALLRLDADNNYVTSGGTVGKLNTVSGFFSLKLTATESSKSVPLTQRHTASIPIDNQKPVGMYTHSSSVVGSNATFGGVAGDTGTPSGLEKVIIWFSKRSGTAGNYTYTNVKWRAGAAGTDTVAAPDGGLPAGITLTMPPIGGNDSIVIDRNDPMGNQEHHGSGTDHKLSMGFANIGGEMSTSWYVVMDSGYIQSGATYAHFIVYDKAGNASYYNQKLMFLNGIPQITTIKLGTDIRDDSTLRTTLGTGNTATPGSTGGKLGAIRARFTTGTDPQRGISEDIVINTQNLNAYSVVYDQPFNVRNRVLAMEVNIETIGTPAGLDNRNFRLEYVSGARTVSGTGTGANQIRNATTGIRAGRVYIINNPGSTVNEFPWGSLGAKVKQDEKFAKGMAFIAIEDGSSLTNLSTTADYGTPSVWELNGSYYQSTTNPLTRTVPTNLQLADVAFEKPATDTVPPYLTKDETKSAEFVYGTNAFSATGATFTANTNATQIMDFNPVANADGRPAPYLTSTANPWEAHSLFIVKVYEGPESDVFGDFALLSIRVNNNDKTKPYAQMYDLNPMTEGSTNTQTQAQALSPQGMGDNRTRGGLWNTTGTMANVAKSGHIEPRTGTSLRSVDMGGAASPNAATINRPMANPAAYFATDTVSGEVILRGYVEDDQRIKRVDLVFYNQNDNTVLQTVPILTQKTTTATDLTFLQAATNTNATGRVSFIETIDLDRHRVEWAYLWNTEAVPNNFVVGNINVRAVAYNTNSTEAGNERIQLSALTAANRTTFDYYNPNFPDSGTVIGTADNGGGGTAVRYNDIRVNIRPYITGFKRDTSVFSHDNRSRQGRYMFRRAEQAVVTGFNLGSVGTNTIQLNGTSATGNASVGTPGNFGLTATNNGIRHRQFTVAAGTVTGNGIITLNINVNNTSTGNAVDYRAVNTSTERPTANNRPTAIQPWNIEYTAAKEGSELWDDFTSVHIWQSNDSTDNAYDRGYFTSSTNHLMTNPAMSIDPSNGNLWASYHEGGNGTTNNINNNNNAGYNVGTTMTANNYNGTADRVTQFIDPIRHSDIYVSDTTTNNARDKWVVSSIIGRSGGGTTQANNTWNALGGIWVNGPSGANSSLINNFTAATSYNVESTWYNASYNSYAYSVPPPTDQFHNPHIVSSGTGNNTERIHVSYYDEKDGSIKYRMNTRNSTTNINSQNTPRNWINLDGGADVDDNAPRTGNPGNANQSNNNNPYDGGTEYTIRQANSGGSATNGTADPTQRYLREIHVTNGQWVRQGDPVYTVGTNTGGTLTVLYAQATGFIVLNQKQVTNQQFGANAAAYRIYTIDTSATTRVVGGAARLNAGTNAGLHNSIALTSQGYPVIAYFDATNQKLKMAVSSSATPDNSSAQNWKIIESDTLFPSATHKMYQFGTGEYVSLKIDIRAGAAQNTFHIAALNSTNKNLVYIKGRLNVSTNLTAYTVTTDTVQIVDSVGNVGRWCSLSIDSGGNPWISYMDESNRGSRDGVKVAYYNVTRFTKGAAASDFSGKAGQDIDIYGTSITGWEAMHVPTGFRVEDARLGMERYPTVRNTNPGNRTNGAINNFGAVGYLGQDRYRIAYYVD